MKESELYPAIFDLFPNHTFYSEVAAGDRSRTTKTIDLVGEPKDERDNDLISIEVKIRDWKRVLRQALDNQFYVELSYAALPERHISALDLNPFASLGIGVISVNGVAKEVIPASRSVYVRESKRRFIVETCTKRSVSLLHD